MSAKTEPPPAAAGHPWVQALAVGPVLTVSELTQRVRSRLQADPRMSAVAVTGEITSFKRHSASGHLYFVLKDAHSRLACVMWRERARSLEFEPEEGLQVVATGYVDVYPAGGSYQLYVQALYPVGLGLWYVRLRALYQRLEREGLFDPSRKRALPRWPRRIGVVTSRDGAALRDIAAVLGRRSPATPVIVAPARVQGAQASHEIVDSLRRLAGWPGVDVIVVARGGGAADELWAFNDERVVRAIAACPVPVVSAVGHETDVTLADLAADVRAPTPSAAAEMAGPDERQAAAQLQALHSRLRRAALRRLELARRQWEQLVQHGALRRPGRWLFPLRQQLDEQGLRLQAAMSRRLEGFRRAWVELATRLGAADPLALLQRGYALAVDPASGRPVREATQLGRGDALRLEMWDGQVECQVERVRPLRRAGGRGWPDGAGPRGVPGGGGSGDGDGPSAR